MRDEARQHALRILTDRECPWPVAIQNAILDLSCHPERGDEQILRPFLEHDDPAVVSATLYTLWEVHNQKETLRPLVTQLAIEGDEREIGCRSYLIQCMAISCVACFGEKREAADIGALLKIAENRVAPGEPRRLAWAYLAQYYGIAWCNEYEEEMLERPESEASEQIRNRVRQAIACDSAK